MDGSGMADRSGGVYTATWIGIAAATASVALRFVAKWKLQVSPYLDDYLMVAALLFFWALAMAGIAMLQFGLGRHAETLKPSDLVQYIKTLYCGAILYPLCICAVKISILWSYRRLFGSNFAVRISCNVLGSLVSLWAICTIVAGVFVCRPVRKFWAPQTPGECFDLAKFYYGIQIPNVLTSAVMLLLPLRPIWKLKISRGKKAALLATFGFGSSAIIFEIMRFIVLIRLARNPTDPTWNQVEPAIWTCLEPAVAITAASLCHSHSLFRDLINSSVWPRMISAARKCFPRRNGEPSRKWLRQLKRQPAQDTSSTEGSLQASLDPCYPKVAQTELP